MQWSARAVCMPLLEPSRGPAHARAARGARGRRGARGASCCAAAPGALRDPAARLGARGGRGAYGGPPRCAARSRARP